MIKPRIWLCELCIHVGSQQEGAETDGEREQETERCCEEEKKWNRQGKIIIITLTVAQFIITIQQYDSPWTLTESVLSSIAWGM